MERRITQRGELKFKVIETQDGRSIKARSSDLSTTGIQLVCYEEPRDTPDQAVELQLYLPGSKRPLSVRAHTVWHTGFRQGLRFVDVHDVDRLDLAELIDRRGKARQPN